MLFMAWILAVALGTLVALNLRDLLSESWIGGMSAVAVGWGRIAAVLGSVALLILTLDAEDVYAYLASKGLSFRWLVILLRPAFTVVEIRSRVVQSLLAIRLLETHRSSSLRRFRILNDAFSRTLTLSFLELTETSLSIATRRLDSGRAKETLRDIQLRRRHIICFLAEMAVLATVWFI